MPFTYKNFSEGHRIRHVIYEKYKNSDIIDFYGDGIPGFSGEFRECFFQYKYVIICENTLQKGFNSEKYNDALLTGCIPIYWGSRVLDTNYDQNSILYFAPNDIDVVNFDFEKSLNLLQDQLDFILKNDPYNNYIDNINHNFNYAKLFMQSENNIYNILEEKNIL
jgi:hypothetical protein